jgi:hypothetical protein
MSAARPNPEIIANVTAINTCQTPNRLPPRRCGPKIVSRSVKCPNMSNLAKVCTETPVVRNPLAARSFYIRFAKITRFRSINLSLPELEYYNVLEQQGFSCST